MSPEPDAIPKIADSFRFIGLIWNLPVGSFLPVKLAANRVYSACTRPAH